MIPLGSVIHVGDAGEYSGNYTVTDKGARVKGRRIDIFMLTRREAGAFGKKRVTVEIVKLGDGRRLNASGTGPARPRGQ